MTTAAKAARRKLGLLELAADYQASEMPRSKVKRCRTRAKEESRVQDVTSSSGRGILPQPLP